MSLHREVDGEFRGVFHNLNEGSVIACPVNSSLKKRLSKNSNRKVSLHISILPRLWRCWMCRGGSTLKQRKSNSSFSKIWGEHPWIWTCQKCDAERLFAANNPTGFADECPRSCPYDIIRFLTFRIYRRRILGFFHFQVLCSIQSATTTIY